MKHRKRRAFTLVEIMLVVMVIGLLAALAMPSFRKARETAREKLCLNNRRLIEAGKDQYAANNDLSAGDEVAVLEVNTYIKNLEGNSAVMSCPSGGILAYQAVGTPPSCSVHAPAAPPPAPTPAPSPPRIPQRGTDGQRPFRIP